MNIALKEARETRYWLTLILDAGLFPPTRLSPILAEIEEIIKVLYSIIQHTKNKATSKS
jgi:four helix bundle protein